MNARECRLYLGEQRLDIGRLVEGRHDDRQVWNRLRVIPILLCIIWQGSAEDSRCHAGNIQKFSRFRQAATAEAALNSVDIASRRGPLRLMVAPNTTVIPGPPSRTGHYLPPITAMP